MASTTVCSAENGKLCWPPPAVTVPNIATPETEPDRAAPLPPVRVTLSPVTEPCSWITPPWPGVRLAAAFRPLMATATATSLPLLRPAYRALSGAFAVWVRAAALVAPCWSRRAGRGRAGRGRAGRRLPGHGVGPQEDHGQDHDGSQRDQGSSSAHPGLPPLGRDRKPNARRTLHAAPPLRRASLSWKAGFGALAHFTQTPAASVAQCSMARRPAVSWRPAPRRPVRAARRPVALSAGVQPGVQPC